MEREAPKAVYVLTTAKKRDDLDWAREFARHGVGRAENGTVAGVLTVDSWNNIGKYADVTGALFIFDEQRLVGNGQWVDKFLKIAKQNQWILLSATPGDTWMDYIPLFLAHGFYKNRTEFKREHVIYNSYTKFPKVDRYVNVSRLVKLRHELLVEMPYIKHTSRKSIVVPVLYDAELMTRVVNDRWNVYENRPLRDVAELFAVARRVANSDSSRLTALSEIHKKHPKMIVFYNFNYELELLRNWCKTSASTSETSSEPISWTLSTSTSLKSSVLLGESSRLEKFESDRTPSKSGATTTIMREWNGHKHEDLPTGDRWVYLVQYVAGAEGWDCITTDMTVFYSQPYSWKIWEQAHGRIDRLSTPFKDLWYYTLLSNSPIDKAARDSLKKKKSFNIAAYGRKTGITV